MKTVVEKVSLQREKNKKMTELGKEKTLYFQAAKNEILEKVNENIGKNSE